MISLIEINFGQIRVSVLEPAEGLLFGRSASILLLDRFLVCRFDQLDDGLVIATMVGEHHQAILEGILAKLSLHALREQLCLRHGQLILPALRCLALLLIFVLCHVRFSFLVLHSKVFLVEQLAAIVSHAWLIQLYLVRR